MARFSKPLVARIQGFCLGGGLGIAMQADLRVASEGSSFGIPAARLGIVYGLGMTRRLVSLVGPSQAKLLLLTGERIAAAEALRIGLVDRVVPAAELAGAVDALARGMAGNAPLSVRGNKLEWNEERAVQNLEPRHGLVDIHAGELRFADRRKALSRTVGKALDHMEYVA